MPMKGGLTIPYHSIRGNINFKNVSFTYPTRPEQVSVIQHMEQEVRRRKWVYKVGYGKWVIGSGVYEVNYRNGL